MSVCRVMWNGKAGWFVPQSGNTLSVAESWRAGSTWTAMDKLTFVATVESSAQSWFISWSPIDTGKRILAATTSSPASLAKTSPSMGWPMTMYASVIDTGSAAPSSR